MASAVNPRLFDPRDRDNRPEITPLGVQQTYVHCRVISTAGLAKPAPLTVIVVRVYSLPQWNQMSFFQDPLCAIWVYTLRGFTSHHVGEPADCWWSTDADVPVEAMVELPNVTEQTGKQRTVNSSSLSGSITGLQWNGRSFFQIHH